jgi:hypothetical protein
MVAEEVCVNFNILILLQKSKKVIFKVSFKLSAAGLQFEFAAPQSRKKYLAPQHCMQGI